LPQSEPSTGWQHAILVVDDEDLVRGLVARSLRTSGIAYSMRAMGRAALGLLDVRHEESI